MIYFVYALLRFRGGPSLIYQFINLSTLGEISMVMDMAILMCLFLVE